MKGTVPGMSLVSQAEMFYVASSYKSTYAWWRIHERGRQWSLMVSGFRIGSLDFHEKKKRVASISQSGPSPK